MDRRKSRVAPQLLEHARSMRTESAPAEAVMWWCLRNRKLNGFKFRRQVPIERYVADFVCTECKLIVELDGDSHFDPGAEERDVRRTAFLELLGYRVIRFTNVDVFENLEGVLNMILDECEWVGVSRPGPSPQPSPPFTGERE